MTDGTSSSFARIPAARVANLARETMLRIDIERAKRLKATIESNRIPVGESIWQKFKRRIFGIADPRLPLESYNQVVARLGGEFWFYCDSGRAYAMHRYDTAASLLNLANAALAQDEARYVWVTAQDYEAIRERSVTNTTQPL